MMQTEHVMPTPAVAGWNESLRLTRAKQFREMVTARGGEVIAERRVRNTTFDRKGERTTFKFTVHWSDD